MARNATPLIISHLHMFSALGTAFAIYPSNLLQITQHKSNRKTMKRFILAAVAIATLAFTGCNQGKIKDLEQRNADLVSQQMQQDSLVNDFMLSFNEFEENLEEIKQREQIIALNSDNPEARKSSKDKIIEDINLINDLLVQNQSIIDELNQKLGEQEGSNKNLRVMVSRLKKQLGERTEQVAQLETQLEDMNFQVATLNTQVDTLSQASSTLRQANTIQSAQLEEQSELIGHNTQVIEEKTEQLHTAYYVAGTAKELKERNILANSGGVLGLGKTPKINANVDPSEFTRIDITEIQSIPVGSKKAKIITAHPSDSYTLVNSDKVVEEVTITNPAKFWKSSKYLVVVLD